MRSENDGRLALIETVDISDYVRPHRPTIACVGCSIGCLAGGRGLSVRYKLGADPLPMTTSRAVIENISG